MALLVLLPSLPARAETEESSPRALTLADEFSDPLTTLPQFFVQDVYTPMSYGTAAQANRVILRAIIPRIPRFSLLPFVQLVRPSFSLVTVPTGRGHETRTAFGDMQLFDLAVIPWPSRETGLYTAVGPTFVFRTATDKAAGQGAWQVGPAFGSVYKGIPGGLLACLVQNPISFAYTSSHRQPVNTLLFQPIVLAYVGRGFYVKSADASWTRVAQRRGDDDAREPRPRLRASARGLTTDQRVPEHRMVGLSSGRARCAARDRAVRAHRRAPDWRPW
jgi:hypothetical protein